MGFLEACLDEAQSATLNRGVRRLRRKAARRPLTRVRGRIVGRFAAVTQTTPTGHVNDPHNRIAEAFAYFTRCVADYLTGADDDEFEAPATADEVGTASLIVGGEVVPGTSGDEDREAAVAARAERLRITPCDLLKVVSITLEPDDNAQVIFETLNARGTPLLALDLVKSAIFQQAARQQASSQYSSLSRSIAA